MVFLCYLLQNVNNSRTYIGVTDNMYRRLRQHNGEISGGAKATHGGSWIVVLCITGFPNRNGALSLETLWKRMYRNRRKRVLDARYPNLVYQSKMSPVQLRQVDLYRLVHTNHIPKSKKWSPDTLTVNWLETSYRMDNLPTSNLTVVIDLTTVLMNIVDE